MIKVVNDTDWGRYKVKGEPPFIIVSHICSTRIPYKTAGKENVIVGRLIPAGTGYREHQEARRRRVEERMQVTNAR